jgi:hypothetical protein
MRQRRRRSLQGAFANAAHPLHRFAAMRSQSPLLASDLAFMRWKMLTPHGLHLLVKVQLKLECMAPPMFTVFGRTKKGGIALPSQRRQATSQST